MPTLIASPPPSRIESITEILHGVKVPDPYRWLEEQDSIETRVWIAAQTGYARSYLDRIPGRDEIRERVLQLLDVEASDSILTTGVNYIFRKRLPGQEQPCVYLRDALTGLDQLLIDPRERGSGKYTAVRPLRASPDGRYLLYEVKEGGERTGTFELLDILERRKLVDALPHGYLRGFAFLHNSSGFYYAHEAAHAPKPYRRAAYHHVLGSRFGDDREIFFAGEGEKLRLHIVPGSRQIGFLVFRFLDRTYESFYLWSPDEESPAKVVVENAEYRFVPCLAKNGRILAMTNYRAPNLRIVEVHPQKGRAPEFSDVVSAQDSPIRSWLVAGERVFVTYLERLKTQVLIFDLAGTRRGELAIEGGDTVRLSGSSADGDDLFFERESFTKPVQVYRHSSSRAEVMPWSECNTPFESERYDCTQVWFTAIDGTRISMYLVGLRRLLEKGCQPTVMTAYGGYGVSMTPQFSVLVATLMERGCLFALPNIRGGSEFGVEWHDAGRRRSKQATCDDFLSAADYLIETGRTDEAKLAIFGGSHSGLLVGAAITQRPELFRAALCMVPILDMLRYHHFDSTYLWREEFGTADDAEDFVALSAYSPYHRVRDNVAYPATMLVSGDRDQNCNPMHARKMTARLQAANISDRPILLDYSPHRGHSPVLPLSARVEALSDRIAFLCDQLGLPGTSAEVSKCD